MAREKYDIVLDVAIVILIVCTLILLYTGYKEFYGKPSAKVVAKPNKPATLQNDSLQKLYSNTTEALNTTIRTDSLFTFNKDDKLKLQDLNLLKEEIATLLKSKNGEADIALAKIKIDELQIKVAALQAKYSGVANENMRLQALLNELLQTNKKENNNQPTDNYNKIDEGNALKNKTFVATKQTSTQTLMATQGLYLFAVGLNNDREQETNLADAAEKIVGSFTCKANANNVNAELMIIVLGPNGMLIKNSEWETGSFETPQGKKIYSKKFFVEKAGEDKKLNFSLTPEYFLKGTYTMQIWSNGALIGKTVKTLI